MSYPVSKGNKHMEVVIIDGKRVCGPRVKVPRVKLKFTETNSAVPRVSGIENDNPGKENLNLRAI